MEMFKIEKEISVICVTAESFPEGIGNAFKKLHRSVPICDKRRQFGISCPDGGTIKYKAAAEEITEREAESLGLERFVIREGEYSSVLIKNFMRDIKSIGRTFQELLKDPDIDPNGYCLEWYLDESDVRCMVKLKDRVII